MILRTLKINDYRARVYLFVFSVLTGLFAVSFSVNHISVFANSAASFLFNGTDYSFFNAIWFKAAGVLLLVANVVLFDYVLSSQELVEKNNHVPAFLLGLYFAYSLQENPLHPQLFAQLLLTLSYQMFISTYRIERAAPGVFNGAFCLSCAVILYPPYWMFFALGFICLGVLRPFNTREYSLVIVGIGLPYLFYYTVLFLCDQSLRKPVQDILNSFQRPSLPKYYNGSFLINFTTVLIILFTGIYFFGKSISSKMKTQKALTVFMWSLIPCVGAMFITNNHYVFTAQMAVMPLSLFTGIYFGSAKRRILAEILLFLLVAVLIVSILQHAEINTIKI
ncbi:MAG TPA: DUF6427 family protein [Bacteroidia bacterium]|jgi:hypothetical protein|nr:DUF6427 family protein [Bacteroidia bacterium]